MFPSNLIQAAKVLKPTKVDESEDTVVNNETEVQLFENEINSDMDYMDYTPS
jgi:hypothetical protein